MKEKIFNILIICVIYAEYQTFDCTNQHAFISLLISDEKNPQRRIEEGVLFCY